MYIRYAYLIVLAFMFCSQIIASSKYLISYCLVSSWPGLQVCANRFLIVITRRALISNDLFIIFYNLSMHLYGHYNYNGHINYNKKKFNILLLYYRFIVKYLFLSRYTFIYVKAYHIWDKCIILSAFFTTKMTRVFHYSDDC